MTLSKISVAAGCIALTAALGARADEPAQKAKATSAAALDEKAIMEKYMKAATPGPEHEKMGKMAGKWKLAVTMWMAPGGPPQKSEGTAEFKPILGGRYLQQEVRGDMNGQPFQGMGVEGYDNVTKERFGTWVDSMSTGPMVMKGKCAADAKKCTLKGKVSDAIAGKEVPVSETVTVNDDNSFTFEMQGPGPDGKMFKTVEILYTRQ